jgi:hypothetical protein
MCYESTLTGANEDPQALRGRMSHTYFRCPTMRPPSPSAMAQWKKADISPSASCPTVPASVVGISCPVSCMRRIQP